MRKKLFGHALVPFGVFGVALVLWLLRVFCLGDVSTAPTKDREMDALLKSGELWFAWAGGNEVIDNKLLDVCQKSPAHCVRLFYSAIRSSRSSLVEHLVDGTAEESRLWKQHWVAYNKSFADFRSEVDKRLPQIALLNYQATMQANFGVDFAESKGQVAKVYPPGPDGSVELVFQGRSIRTVFSDGRWRVVAAAASCGDYRVLVQKRLHVEAARRRLAKGEFDKPPLIDCSVYNFNGAWQKDKLTAVLEPETVANKMDGLSSSGKLAAWDYEIKSVAIKRDNGSELLFVYRLPMLQGRRLQSTMPPVVLVAPFDADRASTFNIALVGELTQQAGLITACFLPPEGLSAEDVSQSATDFLTHLRSVYKTERQSPVVLFSLSNGSNWIENLIPSLESKLCGVVIQGSKLLPSNESVVPWLNLNTVGDEGNETHVQRVAEMQEERKLYWYGEGSPSWERSNKKLFRHVQDAVQERIFSQFIREVTDPKTVKAWNKAKSGGTDLSSDFYENCTWLPKNYWNTIGSAPPSIGLRWLWSQLPRSIKQGDPQGHTIWLSGPALRPKGVVVVLFTREEVSDLRCSDINDFFVQQGYLVINSVRVPGVSSVDENALLRSIRETDDSCGVADVPVYIVGRDSSAKLSQLLQGSFADEPKRFLLCDDPVAVNQYLGKEGGLGVNTFYIMMDRAAADLLMTGGVAIEWVRVVAEHRNMPPDSESQKWALRLQTVLSVMGER